MTTQLKKQAPRFAYFQEAQNPDLFPLFIALIVVLSYGRVFFLRDVFWDDNCWLLSVYASKDLGEFLNTGWTEMRRVSQGTFFYYLFALHKNTDYFYLIGHVINLATQILIPVFLYLLMNNLFEKRRLLSSFIAVSFIIFPLDNTLPYFSAMNYRLGGMLSIISFYLTERALAKDASHWTPFIAAILASIASHYIFIEASIAYEPARLLMIGYILSKKGVKGKSMMKRSLMYWSPFLLLCIPLVVYKLTYKQYGIYARAYKTDLLFFLKWKEHLKVIVMLLLYQWKFSLQTISDVKVWSAALAMLTAIAGIILLKRAPITGIREIAETGDWRSFKNRGYFLRNVLILGIVLLIPPIILLEFAGREIGPGFNSSHFNHVQFGYALITGSLLYIAYITCIRASKRVFSINLIFALILGAGVFSNNLNLDLYYKGAEIQKKFWNVFTLRFPALPERASFLADVSKNDRFYNSDLDTTYELEYTLNLLYAKSSSPEDFRRYRVYTMPEGFKEQWKKSNAMIFERSSHWGKDTFDSRELIILHYNNGELLINREILDRYPEVPYNLWLDKGFPKLPEPVSYPLRHKFYGV